MNKGRGEFKKKPRIVPPTKLAKKSDLPIPAASALIIHGGKILFIQRAKEPTKGKWAFPGGQVEIEKGETSERAAMRETKEEVGLKIEIKRKLGTYITQNREFTIDCFIAGTKRSGLRLILELMKAKLSSEIIKTRWCKSEEGLSLDLTSTARQALEDFLKATS